MIANCGSWQSIKRMRKILTFTLLGLIGFTCAAFGARKVAVQSYSFADATLDELPAILKEVGVDAIGASGGLRLSKQWPDQRFNNSMTPEQREYAKKILKDNNLKIISYGVVGSKTEQNVIDLCKFAQEFDCPVILTEDHPKQFPFWEKYGPQYGVKMALHNHATDVKNGYWNPEYVSTIIAPYKHVVSAADNGHWARSGVDTVKGHNVLKGRMTAIHLKDINTFGQLAFRCEPYGEGVLGMETILKNLDAIGYDGYLVIEYEGVPNPVSQVKACVDYLRNN